MRIYFTAYLIAFFATALVSAQQTSIPIKREFAKAYLKKTRSMDGKPGANYWQNSSDYILKAKISTDNTLLEGEATITYYNNSPDTLDKFVLRIAQDLYKKGVTRNQPIKPGDITDGVLLSSLQLNGVEINQTSKDEFRRIGTNAVIKLKNKILPGSKTNLSIKWSFHIPQLTYLRMGKADDGSYFMAYWYPEVAVYDDVNGWDMSHYEGLQEFYHDVNRYDVTIEAGNEYAVWATGELQNANEVYSKEFVQQMNAAFTSDKVVALISTAYYRNNTLPIKKTDPTNQWKFTATRCPDFAFTFGKRYLWDACGTTLKDGRRIKVNAVYRPEAKDFPEVADLAKKALNYLSDELPGVPYPYPQMTVVHGSPMDETGGMEFPMLCNNPTASDRGRAADVTSHEIAHTWFPFFVLTNERQYAWMDEGWAAFLPAEYMKRVEPSGNRLVRYVRELNRYTFDYINDLPIVTPSHSLDVYNYFGGSYSKPALAYYFLKDELGAELFTATLQEYINRWQFKHPIPYDFFFTFNNASGHNLDWFWKKWFFEANVPDLAIKDVKLKPEESIIVLQRIGELPVPVALKIVYVDGTEESIYKTFGVWKDGKKEITFKTRKDVKTVVLGNEYIPDIALENNSYNATK